jgi:hypothetical protein
MPPPPFTHRAGGGHIPLGNDCAVASPEKIRRAMKTAAKKNARSATKEAPERTLQQCTGFATGLKPPARREGGLREAWGIERSVGELNKDSTSERDQQRERAEQNAREQAELDRIATMRFSTAGVRV